MLEVIIVPSSVENCFFIFETCCFLAIAIIEGPLPEIVAHSAPDFIKFNCKAAFPTATAGNCATLRAPPATKNVNSGSLSYSLP